LYRLIFGNHFGFFIILLGGDDVPMFEPVKRLNVRNIDRIIRNLRQIYKENPGYFDIPEFAQKIY